MNQKMWSEKEKKNKNKKKKRWTIRTLFIFISVTFEFGTDEMLFVVLFCWNCIAEDFVAQFDIGGSGTMV